MIDNPETTPVEVTVDEPEEETELTYQGLKVTILADAGKMRKVVIDDPERNGIFEYYLDIPKLKYRKMIAKIAAALSVGGNQTKIDAIAKAHGIDPSELDTLDENELTAEEQKILMGDASIVRAMDVFSEVIFICFVKGKFPDSEIIPVSVEEFEEVVPMDHAMALFKPAMSIINASFVTGSNRKK